MADKAHILSLRHITLSGSDTGFNVIIGANLQKLLRHIEE
jgi:hypothetical protein